MSDTSIGEPTLEEALVDSRRYPKSFPEIHRFQRSQPQHDRAQNRASGARAKKIALIRKQAWTFALVQMDDDDLQAHSERALVVVTLGTVSLVAFLGLLTSV
jgi:hypothetical protein